MPQLHRLSLATLAVALMTGVTPAMAQSDDDWDLIVDAEQERTVASVEYDSGTAVITQCRARSLQIVVAGLPQATPGGRWHQVRRADGATRRAMLVRQTDGRTLTAGADPRLLRFLKGGGRLTLSSDAREAPMRVVLDLPTSSNGLDAVLTACGYPTTNDRDALLNVEEILTELPVLEMPRAVVERRATPTFEVAVSCVVTDGRYTACRSERETPPHPADGQQTADVLNGTPVPASDRAAAEGGVLDLVVTGSRIRR